jgi:hypothetical protein
LAVRKAKSISPLANVFLLFIPSEINIELFCRHPAVEFASGPSLVSPYNSFS